MFINWWMNKHITVYLYNEIPLSNKTEQTTTDIYTRTWMDFKCIILSERSQTQMAILLYDSISMTSLQRRITGTEIRLVVARCWGWERGSTAKGHEGTSWHDGNVCTLIVTTVHTCQTHKIVHLEMLNFTVCNLYIQEPDLKKKNKATCERKQALFCLWDNTFNTYYLKLQ